MILKPTPKQYHIIYRNIAGSMRQTWVIAHQHYAAIEQFKQDLGHTMDPEHSPLNIKEMDNGVAVNRWYMENAYKGLPERRDV
tara:strand:+ start:384 stop:632 length:249 start_codon:yes stop_codon:yes gene_type:complete